MSFSAVEMTHFCVHLEVLCRFLAFTRWLNVRDCTPHRLLMRRCRWLTGQVGPPPSPLRGRPHRLTAGRGAAVPAPARTVSGNVSYCRGPVRGEKKQQTFYKCTQKCIISIPPRDTKPELRGHGKVVFHIALEFSDCCEPFVRKSSENGQIRRAVGVDSRRWPGMTTRSTLRTPVGERDPCCSFSARTG